jgi:hypothetical protein
MRPPAFEMGSGSLAVIDMGRSPLEGEGGEGLMAGDDWTPKADFGSAILAEFGFQSQMDLRIVLEAV